MWGCYNDAVDRPPPSARVALVTMTAEREDLYRNVPPPGYLIPVGDPLLLVDDGIPEDKEIAWALIRLRLNRSGSPSGMRAEHLCQWLIVATRDESLDGTIWLKVVAIMQASFCDETLAK